jgi:hypothetical protein
MDTGHSQKIFDFTLRGNYSNYYNIKFFVQNRANKETPGIGYIPAEVEYKETENGPAEKINVEFADIPYLCQHDKERAKNYLSYLIAANKGDEQAKQKASFYREQYLNDKEWYYKDVNLSENKFVVHSGTKNTYDHFHISHKGSNLLKMIKEGYPVPDFSILSSDWFSESESEKDKHLQLALSNLEQMTGEKLGNAESPLIFAIRCAMPQYIPGLMPTYLNAGVVPDVVETLKHTYGIKVAGKIYLNNLLTLYSLLYHDTNIPLLKEQQYHSSTGEIYKKIQIYFDLINQKDNKLLYDAYYQIKFLLRNACDFFEKNKDLPYTLIRQKTFPSFILQKMVWTVRDRNSYPGILYSRHTRTGLGKQIESCMNIFGEDIMTGNLEITDTEYFDREEIKESYPAVYHFSPLLKELEKTEKSPVTIEFAAESYENTHLFAVLQLNNSELTGRACLLSAIDLYEKDVLNKDDVIKLVQPYHLRQIFSETIDKKALSELIFFSEGISVLPRSAISVKIYFSAEKAMEAKKQGEKVCYCKDHFVPSDTVIMKELDAIISLHPAAIHVVTACRGYGIPAFLNLESYGIKLQESSLVNSQNTRIKEGDWITISSKKKTIYIGKATYTPARFQKYLEGDKFPMEPKEEAVFLNMAKAYKSYEAIINSLEHSDISSLEDLTKLIRNDMEKDQDKAAQFVNKWYDSNSKYYAKQILKSELGTHQDQHRIYKLLSVDRQVKFFKKVIQKCIKKELKGYKAGSFMLGRFICIEHPGAFWKELDSNEIAFLLNEYILFEKYMYVLYNVGESKLSKAKAKILENGLDDILINKGKAGIFIPLKIVTHDWNKIMQSLPVDHEKESEEIIELLQKPYGFFFDYSKSWDLETLKKISEREGIEIPNENDM